MLIGHDNNNNNNNYTNANVYSPLIMARLLQKFTRFISMNSD